MRYVRTILGWALLVLLAACTTNTTIIQVPTATALPAPVPTSAATPSLVPTLSPTSVPTIPPTSAPTSAPTIEPTAMQAEPTAQDDHRPSGSIIFLDPDGVMIKRMQPDGSAAQMLATITRPAGYNVVSLSANPDGSALVYGLLNIDAGIRYVLQTAAITRDLGLSALDPHWSPDGQRLLVERYSSANTAASQTVLYDLAHSTAITYTVGYHADWFPDGASLVAVATGGGQASDNIVRYELATQRSTPLTKLTPTNDDAWLIDYVHVLPGGTQIIFYGAQAKNLGMVRNGKQWWWIPAEGGDPQPFSDPNGNDIVAYASNPADSLVAYAEHVHENLCANYDTLVFSTSDVQGGIAASAPLPTTGAAQGIPVLAHIRAANWSPTGAWLTFDAERFTCGNDALHPLDPSPTIYIWNTHTGNGTPVQLIKLADGSFPSWVR